MRDEFPAKMEKMEPGLTEKRRVYSVNVRNENRRCENEEEDVDMGIVGNQESTVISKHLASEDGDEISMARFRQRTEVFESLLAYLNPDAVQPSGSLLDLLDGSDL